MVEFFVKTALTLALPPALVTLVGLLVASALEKRGKERLSRWLTGLTFALAYLVGHRIATGSFPTDLNFPEQWVPILSILASLLSIADNWWQTRFPARFFLRTLFGMFAVAVLIYPLQTLTVFKKAIWCIVAGTGIALAWSAKDSSAETQNGVIAALTLSILSAFASASLFIGRTALVSQLAGVTAAICAISFLFSLFRKELKLSSGAAGVATVLLLSLVANGLFYAELPIASAILFWLTFLTGWVQFLPAAKELSQPIKVLTQLLTAAILSGFALGITVYKLGLPASF